MSTLQHEEAKKIKEELFIILENSLHATPKDCELLGDKFRKDQEYIKAILMYQAGEVLVKESSNEFDEIINCLQGCALGLKMAAADLMKERGDLRSIVADDIVPAMRRIYVKLSDRQTAGTTISVLIRSLCLHHIETTELLCDDNTVRERTLREAVALMEKEFGEAAGKHHLYSCHLNNLGVFCMTQERPREAICIFEKSIESRRMAEDYTTEQERAKDLAASEDGLRKAKEMLRFMQE